MVTQQNTLRRGANRQSDTGLRRVKLPPSGKAILQDGDGLILTVSEAGGRRVARAVYRFRLEGKRLDMRLGSWPDKSLADIRKERDNARDYVLQGHDPRQAIRQEIERAKAEAAARLIVADVFATWDKTALASHKDGGEEARRYFTVEILPAIGNLPIGDVGRRNVASIVDGIIARGRPRAAQVTLGLLKQFFTWGEARGYTEKNPCAALRIASIKVNPPRTRILSDGEITTLFDALNRRGGWIEPALRLILATACRAGEILKAQWAHIDVDNRAWTIPAENAKNGEAHIIDLSSFAMEQIDALMALRQSDWVLPGRRVKQPMCGGAINNIIRRKQSSDFALSGGQWTAHDLRRSAATIMQRLGILPAVIERCLNHKEASKIVAVYQRHDYRAERREAFNRLGNHLAALAANEPGRVVSIRRAAQ